MQRFFDRTLGRLRVLGQNAKAEGAGQDAARQASDGATAGSDRLRPPPGGPSDAALDTDHPDAVEGGSVLDPLPPDFDVVRYIGLNPDLAHLKDAPHEAERHYRVEGRAEGRAYKLDTDRFGHLPADFDVPLYIALNPDLAHLRDSPYQAEEHYLVEGRPEGRPYKVDANTFGQRPADFDTDIYIDLNPDLEKLRSKPLAAEQHYLGTGRKEGRSYKIASRPDRLTGPSIESRSGPSKWKKAFKPGDFRAMRPDLAKDGDTRATLLAAFKARGIEAMVPLRFGMSFDPAFYAERYPHVATLSDTDRYREWLEVGLKAGRPATERDAVFNLLGLPDYPESFDWRRYVEALPRRVGPERWTRLAALEHLVQIGVSQALEIPLTGATSGVFLLALSDVTWEAGRRVQALKVLRKALDVDPSNGEVHQRMAHRCMETGQLRIAQRHETRALELGQDSVWVYCNLINLASRRDDVAESYRLLALSKARFEGFGPWRQALTNTIERDYAHTATLAWELYEAGGRDDADRLLTEGLTRIADALRRLDDLPGWLGPAEDGHVVLFANHVLPQCRHYRIEQRCRQMDLLGIPYEVFASPEAEAARQALVGARALIVYREPAFTGTVRLLIHARAMGVPTFYDIDDLIFDAAHYPEGYDTYEKQITFKDYVGLLYGVPLVRFAMSLCDVGLTSTTPLSRHVAPLTISGRCPVIPNGLDQRNARFLDLPLRPAPRADEEVVIFYGSGSRAHNRNFNETVGPALLAVMARHRQVRLVVAGYLDLDPGFAPFADRVQRFPFSKNVEAYWALLSEVDINLAVLTPGEMNDGKSEIKWLEAAASGVPSVVSASALYRQVIEHGIDGLLADSPQAWQSALFTLVEDVDLRRRIGARARARALADYSLDATARHLAAALRSSPSPPPSRMRVLVVHVLFPPQSSGGATRVVRDNVDDLIDRYGEEFELAVFTTDFDAPVPPAPPVAKDPADARAAMDPTDVREAEDPAPVSEADAVVRSSRVGSYRGLPVFRVSRGGDTEFTYRDEITGRQFADVLRFWKPNIVHFHCIQFLTGTIVETCAKAGIPYIITLHDAWWISPYQFLIDDDALLRTPRPRGLVEGAASMVEIDRKLYLGDRLSGAAALLAVSDSFAEIYRRAGFPQTRPVPNGLSSLFLDPPERQGDLSTQRRVRIGHIGGLTHHKGYHLLQLALEQGDFENLEAIMVDHTQLPDYERHLTWGSTPVLVRGPADQDGVRALYEGLDVLAAPSIWPESYGLVSREALAMGLWVIASNLGALGEDVVDGQNGFLVDVKDTRDLDRVLRLIDAEPDKFRSSPRRAFVPRLASDQTDDLVAIYRTFAPAGAPN